MATNRELVGQEVLEIIQEASTFGGGGDFDTPGADRTKIWDFSRENAATALIETQVNSVRGGENPDIPGLAKCQSNPVTFSTYVEGVRTAAGDGTTPTKTAITRLLESHAQSAAVSTTGDLILAAPAPTTTSWKEANAGRHDPGAGKTGLVAVNVAGDSRVYVRPYTYSTDTFTLLLALPNAPAADDILYGGFIFHYTMAGPISDLSEGISLAAQFLGASTTQHIRLLGMVARMEIPETTVGEGAPAFSWSALAASYSQPAETRADPSAALGTCMVGHEWIVGAYGDTTPTTLSAASVAVTGGGDMDPWRGGGETHGLLGYTRLKGYPRVKVTIPRNETASVPAACSGSTWEEIANDPQESTNRVHICGSYSRTAGRIFGIYIESGIVKNWSAVEKNGVDMQSFDIVPDDSLDVPVAYSQS